MNRKTLPLSSIYSYLSVRASVSASIFNSIFNSVFKAVFKLKSTSEKDNRKGSITVEAAMAVPIFFLAVVSLLYLMEIMAIQTSIRAGLQYAGKKVAEEACILTVIMPSSIEKDIIEAVGAERLDRSIVLGGSKGVRCDGSRLSMQTGIGELAVSYQVRLPIPVFGVPPIKYQEKIRVKVWNGYEKPGFGTDHEETVYVTENGLVYHRDYHCTHLELSIHMVTSGEIDRLRNHSGGKYYPCERCMRHGESGVYITDTGDRYHSSLSCSGLKRTIYAVPLSEVIGKGECSRCGQ